MTTTAALASRSGGTTVLAPVAMNEAEMTMTIELSVMAIRVPASTAGRCLSVAASCDAALIAGRPGRAAGG